MTTVPNRFPTIQSARRVALIGEAPGADEVNRGEPFVGASGRFLASLLSQAGLSRDTCFLGNISQHRPHNNDISTFSWTGPEITQGLETLRTDIKMFNPNIVVLLGNTALKAAKDYAPQPHLKKFKYSNSNWRGSLFLCTDPSSPFYNRKCMAAYHPAFVLREMGNLPLLLFDLKRACVESMSSTLELPERKFVIAENAGHAEYLLYDLIPSVAKALHGGVGTDLEGYVNRLQCIAFAPDKHVGYVVPFLSRERGVYFPDHKDELRVWKALAWFMENYSIPKIWQNGLYDRFVLEYGHGIRCCNNDDDIMLRHWELNSELSKGENNEDKRKAGLNLAIQTSIYTKQPYYKGDYSASDDYTFWRYNGMDACVTKEINEVVEKCLTAPCSKAHYRLNKYLLNPLLYMEKRGMRYDVAKAASRRYALQQQLYAAQARLNGLTGHGFPWTHPDQVFQKARELMGFKRANIQTYEDLESNCTKPYIEIATRLRYLSTAPNQGAATIGEVEKLCEVSLNLGSNKQVCEFLYSTLGLPTQWTQPKRGSQEEPRPTADYEALLKLSKEVSASEYTEDHRRIVALLIEIRSLETRQRMLSIGADRDGRIRCGYNIVGSNTGRITCYESPTGSGYNLQTIPNYTRTADAPGGILGDRDLFLADEGQWFFQCDLKGADGWTVAAYCAMLGDRTMLEDYLYGLKPYNIVTCKMRGYEGDFSDRAWLKDVCKKVEKDSWDGFACKRIQHGKTYFEGDLTVSRNILKDSEGKLYLPPKECGLLGKFYLERYYGIPRYHNHIASCLRQSNRLCAASGQIREFFGRPDDLLTKAVAFEPQANTSYATNLAINKLWNDPDNRVVQPNQSSSREGCKLKIEPLHQVHDAVCGQFAKNDTPWAVDKIKSYFNNPLSIAGQDITIPFDGAYGESWGSLKEGTI